MNPAAQILSPLRKPAAKIPWYYLAALLLLIIAAALRFHDLSGNTIYADEAAIAFNSRGSLAGVIINTRINNSSPILYPLLSYIIQQVDRSAFSIRVVPAIASVLTVAVILLLLPRVGVSRPAALLAALLATLSTAAVEYAQFAREYSMDTLVAVLLIAGLLWYLREGRKALLGVALLLAPLVQYGLVLFGGAVLLTALLAGRAGNDREPTVQAKGIAACPARLWSWLKRRLDLAIPAALFLAGSVSSYFLTLRHQAAGGGFAADSYLAAHYYSGGLDPVAILSFAAARLGLMLNYHLPAVVVALTLITLALLLLASWQRRRMEPIVLLFLITLGVAAGAALLQLYPLGSGRQSLYLGPVVFVTAGVSLSWAASRLAALARRPVMRPALLAGLAVVAALGSMAALQQKSPYQGDSTIREIGDILEELARAEDLICVSGWESGPMEFYYGQRDNYRYGCTWDWVEEQGGLEELLAALGDSGGRLYLVGSDDAPGGESDLWPQVKFRRLAHAEQLVSGGPHLWRLAAQAPPELSAQYSSLRAREPDARGGFDLYLDIALHRRENTLYYLKEPCVPADTLTGFYLEISPAFPGVLPGGQEQENTALTFGKHNKIFDGKCLAAIALPDYAIGEIRTGQSTKDGVRLWEGAIRVDRVALYQAAYADLGDTPPQSRAVFDLYLHNNALHYFKEPCAPSDMATRFFLHLTPANPADLPPEQQPYGVGNRDFDFARQGAFFDGKCLAVMPLPDYPIIAIQTGQSNAGNRLWETAFPIDRTAEHRATYAALAGREPAARATFDLYLRDNNLHYVRESCADTDTAARFYLHIVPVNQDDLPVERRQYGADNRDFDFDWRGATFDGKCLATIPLPDYPIAEVITGQDDGGGRLWETSFALDRAAEHRATYAALANEEPVHRAVFDLYLQDNNLHYVRESCTETDTAARFYLHIVPVNQDDLPAERRPHGTDNRDFDFDLRGAIFDGKCLATVPLPDYPIAAIRTGQFIPNQEPAWTAEFSVGR